MPDFDGDLTLNSTENKLTTDIPVVFPNPAVNYLTIESNASGIVRLEIHTLLGQVIRTYVIDSQSSQTIDITSLPNGVYSLYLSEKGIVKRTEKLIKK